MTAMTQYALIPTQLSENVPCRTPSDQEALDYFILVELADAGMEDDEAPPPVVIASWRFDPGNDETLRACAHAEPYRDAVFGELTSADMFHLCG